LTKLVEYGDAALHQSPTIDRGLDSPRPAVEKLQTKNVFNVSNGLGYGWLRNGEIGCGLPHAARLCNGEYDVQVSQFEAPPDAVRPSHVQAFPNSYVTIKQ
jgi:hypothetical protein